MKTIPVIMISGILGLVIAACGKQAPVVTNTEMVVCVKTETLTETKTVMPIQCSGVLASKRMIKLSFKTGGIIAGINVDEGSIVKKGQVIASLDMTEISSQADQVQLAFEKAERDLKRVRNLYRDTVTTLEQLQDATSAYETALENKNIADFNKRFSRITAPANGRIIARLAEEHELVEPGMPVLIFSEQGKDEWVIKAGVSDKEIMCIKKGDKAEACIDAFPGLTFPAYVSQVSEAADPMSGTFEIEITIDPGNERMINGLVAKVKIEAVNSQMLTLVPPDAVTEADGRKGFVYIVQMKDTTAKKIPVTIAYLQNSNVAVLEPIGKMGQVITEGAAYLEDGVKINLSK